MMVKQSYANHLTAERSKERLKGAVWVKCVDCVRMVRSHCEIWDAKVINRKAPRICRHFKPIEEVG